MGGSPKSHRIDCIKIMACSKVVFKLIHEPGYQTKVAVDLMAIYHCWLVRVSLFIDLGFP